MLKSEEVVPQSAGEGNRAQRRANMKEIKRMTRPITGCQTMYHPVLTTRLTPRGIKLIANRRRKSKDAKQARKVNYG